MNTDGRRQVKGGKEGCLHLSAVGLERVKRRHPRSYRVIPSMPAVDSITRNGVQGLGCLKEIAGLMFPLEVQEERRFSLQ